MEGGARVTSAHGGIQAFAQPIEDGLAKAGMALFEALEIGADFKVDGVLAIARNQQAAFGFVATEAVVIVLIKQGTIAGHHDGQLDERIVPVLAGQIGKRNFDELLGDRLGFGLEDGGERLVGFGLAAEEVDMFGPQDAGVGQHDSAGFELTGAGSVPGYERGGDASEGRQCEG
jgi:hypothetical protein